MDDDDSKAVGKKAYLGFNVLDCFSRCWVGVMDRLDRYRDFCLRLTLR